ncbi:MAG TPA: flagella basal body P-ring formation protein FlgA [Kofleriaceae bacterium]
MAARPPRHNVTDLAVAIAFAVAAVLAVLAHRAAAGPKVLAAPAVALEDTIRDRLIPELPAGLDIARIYLPANLAGQAIDPSRVIVELPRELRAGRPSIKLTLRGKPAIWVPVAIAVAIDVAVAQRDLAPGDVITDGDLAIEHRAVADGAPAAPATLVGATVTQAIAAGAPIVGRSVALPPPLPRGTQVSVDVRRGSVHIRGTATLETAARPGELASARLAATRLLVHGTLVAPATLVVGDGP